MNKKELRKYQANYSRQRYNNRMTKMHEILGGVCCVCGTSEELEIHHKDPEQKKFSLSVRHALPWEVVLEELSKCELRCRKHHAEFHAPKHGTISCYRRLRCRCDPCRKAWNLKAVEWKRNSRFRKKTVL